MKPTTNQLLTAIAYSPVRPDAIVPPYNRQGELNIDRDPKWNHHQNTIHLMWITTDENYRKALLQQLMAECGEDYHEIMADILSNEYSLPVRIKPMSNSLLHQATYKSLQVPIEPLEVDFHLIYALLWCEFPSRSLNLVPYAGEYNLLVQAKYAALKIDLLLGFELAGVPAPRVYDNWREPDGVSCPYKGIMESHPSWGELTIHYHNGQLALVTCADNIRAEIIHLDKVEGTVKSDVGELIAFNGGKKPSKKKEREEKDNVDAAKLAMKFMPSKLKQATAVETK